MSKRKRTTTISKEEFARLLGADNYVSVKELSKKLLSIVNDTELPDSVRDAARKELEKFERRPR